MHHIDHWETGGPTDLENLIPVCTRHHTLIQHETGLLGQRGERPVADILLGEVGIALLGTLMIFVFYNDIIRIFTQ